MHIHRIDPDRCTGCGECIADCPSALFAMNGEGHRACYNDPGRRCIKCGHCIAVCPANAVVHDFDADDHDVPGYRVSGYDDVMSHLASRRSVRRYRNETISRDDIEKVLEAIRYAPSASNKRSWSFIVVTDKEKLHELSAKTVAAFKFIRMVLNIRPLVPLLFKGRESVENLKVGVESVINDFQNGKDRILFNAPCCIILHSPGYGHMSGVDAGIALTHGSMAAHALGLGTCWIGFVMELLFLKSGLRKWLGVPKGEKVWGVMVLGKPDVSYHAVAPRDQLRVNWVRRASVIEG